MVHNLRVKEKLLEGVQLIADAVGCTLGPKGANVLIQGPSGVLSTKDGITVADYVSSEDPVETLAIDSLRSAAFRTNKMAGDGTTSSIILAKEFFERGLKLLDKGWAPERVKKELDAYVKSISDCINSLTRVVRPEKIKDVATIAANNDPELGTLIADAFAKVDNTGIVEPTSSLNHTSFIECTNGFRLDKGFYEASLFLNMDAQKMVLENPIIILYNGKMNNVQEVVAPVLQQAKNLARPVLFLTKEVDNAILRIIGLNQLQKDGVKAMVVNVPGYGEAQAMLFKDLGIYTKASVLTPSTVRTSFAQASGSARKVIIRSSQTVIEGGAGEADFTIEAIKKETEGQKENTYDEGRIQERIKRANTKLAMVFVGAKSELELKDKLFRAEDAIRAVQCSLEGGILPGAGNALKHADKSSVGNKFIGCVSVIHNLINEPKRFEQFEFNKGKNCLTEKHEEDLIKAGIVDTTKGIVTALESAGSVASTLLLTEICITEN